MGGRDPGGDIVSIPFLTGLCLLLYRALRERAVRPWVGFNPLPNGAVSAPEALVSVFTDKPASKVSIPFLTGLCLLLKILVVIAPDQLQFQSPS